MRLTLLIGLLAAAVAFGQETAPPPAACSVVAGPLDVNEAGELERPAPTAEECDRAGALEEKFLATSPGEFRRALNVSRAPESVQIYVGSLSRGPIRNPRPIGPGNVIGSYPERPDVVTWLSPELVVVAYRTTDFAGSATSVTLADLATLSACEYLRWSGGELPMQLSIREIQAALDRGRLGEREAPACYLRSLTID